MSIFEDLNLDNQLLTSIKNIGITKPTVIQERSIPNILNGKDVIGESATGSGKTLAFGCGIVEHVSPRQGLQALILTPTRELAFQVRNSISQLSFKKLQIIPIYGGVSINEQIKELHHADVVVATPGRLLDHLNRKTINLSKIKILVLDEADRMLDMGFMEDVEKIIRLCPRTRQTLFFSATMPPRIKTLANKYMNHPVQVSANNQVDPAKLKQVYYDVARNIKLSLLTHLLQKEDSDLVMVFCNSRKTVDFVTQNLKSNKVNTIAIHGGFSQNKRTKTIDMFNKGKVGVLVCTDVAARGLHIDNVSHVYNYEIPKDSNDYIHRIGRTARAGERGKVINLLCDIDHDNFSRILNNHTFNITKLEKPHVNRINTIRMENPRHARQGFRKFRRRNG